MRWWDPFVAWWQDSVMNSEIHHFKFPILEIKMQIQSSQRVRSRVCGLYSRSIYSACRTMPLTNGARQLQNLTLFSSVLNVLNMYSEWRWSKWELLGNGSHPSGWLAGATKHISSSQKCKRKKKEKSVLLVSNALELIWKISIVICPCFRF